MREDFEKQSKKLLFAILFVFLLVGCASSSIREIKSDDNIGDEVTVRGVIKESVKIGDLSGFILEDDYGESIRVSSKSLPAEGKKVTVTGVLRKDLLGYYIVV